MKQELELKLDEITVETDELIILQSRVAKALEATKEPLRVTLLCVEERSDRKMVGEKIKSQHLSHFPLLSNSNVVYCNIYL